MSKITVTTDYCEIIDEFDVSLDDLDSPMARTSLMLELKDAVRIAWEREQAMESEEES